MDVEVAVVGGGVMGLAAAWRAAEAGAETLLLERFTLGHDRGSSHGATRIFRTAYDHPDYVAIARATLPWWRILEGAHGELLRITGGIDLGPRAELEVCARALAAHGASFEWIDRAEAARRVPGLETDHDELLWSPDAGVIAAARVVEALAVAARAAGAILRERAAVVAVEPSDDGVLLHTSTDIVRARRAIVAAGPWIGGLLAPLGIAMPVRVTREQVTFYDRLDLDVPVIERGRRFFYAVPGMFGAPGTKAAEHVGGAEVDPDTRTFEPDPDRASPVDAWVGARFPSSGAVRIAHETCLYTLTPDEHFVIDEHGPLVVVSACSGHGFKFAPLIGEAAAALALGRRVPFPLETFRLGRF